MCNTYLYHFIIVNIVLLTSQVIRIHAQGQRYCYTPHNHVGMCLYWSQCPSLLNYYSQYQNYPGIREYFSQSKRNCGANRFSRDPLVCCNTIPLQLQTQSDQTPFQQASQQYQQQPQAQVQTNPEPVTQQQPSLPAPQSPEQSCRDPSDVEGVCRNIDNCPDVLNELAAKKDDAPYLQYIKDSNVICQNVESFICCPLRNLQTPISYHSIQTPNVGIQGRLLTPQEGCGSSNAPNHRIVGGKSARPGAFPWMAVIGYDERFGGLVWKCGGSLITTRHVLTAAHCVLPNLSIVRLGVHDISSPDGEAQDVKVTRSERHTNYYKKDGTNDIAILYLDRDVEFTKRIRVICLPYDEPIRSGSFVGNYLFIAGWGFLQEGGKTSNVLQQLQLPILENTVCKEQFRSLGKLISENQFNDTVICAGNLAGGSDSCQGDSGGPLMQPLRIENTRSVHYYQIGIVSYGIGCARTNTPGVYVRIQYFIDWIQEKLRQ